MVSSEECQLHDAMRRIVLLSSALSQCPSDSSDAAGHEFPLDIRLYLGMVPPEASTAAPSVGGILYHSVRVTSMAP